RRVDLDEAEVAGVGADQSLDEARRGRRAVGVHQADRGLDVVVDAAEGEADDRGQHDRADDPLDEERPVAQPSPQVGAGDHEGGPELAHGSQSRSALPVRARNTSSRSGSVTSTPPTATPVRSAATMGASAVLPCSTRTTTLPSRASAPSAPGSSAQAAAKAARSPVLVTSTWSPTPSWATSSRRVPSAIRRPSSMMPMRSQSRSASSM